MAYHHATTTGESTTTTVVAVAVVVRGYAEVHWRGIALAKASSPFRVPTPGHHYTSRAPPRPHHHQRCSSGECVVVPGYLKQSISIP